jgi:hypothetical protein
VFVGVSNDKPRRSQHQDGDVASKFTVIEGGFVLNHERIDRLTGKGSIKGVYDQRGVIPTALNGFAHGFHGHSSHQSSCQ